MLGVYLHPVLRPPEARAKGIVVDLANKARSKEPVFFLRVGTPRLGNGCDPAGVV